MSKASDIPKIPKQIWDKAREKAKSLILIDAAKGIFQGKSTAKERYKSKTYTKYKANSMQRFGRGINKVGAGSKLKGFTNISTDTTTSFVNMRLTGETLRRISTKNLPAGNGFKIIYPRGEIVDGNAKHGYIINDLNDKNFNEIAKIVSVQLDKNIRKFTRKDTVLRVG